MILNKVYIFLHVIMSCITKYVNININGMITIIIFKKILISIIIILFNI